MHCAEDVEVTVRNVSLVQGSVGLCSFNIIQENHVITLDSTDAHVLDGRIRFRKERFRNYVEATSAVRHANPPCLLQQC